MALAFRNFRPTTLRFGCVCCCSCSGRQQQDGRPSSASAVDSEDVVMGDVAGVYLFRPSNLRVSLDRRRIRYSQRTAAWFVASRMEYTCRISNHAPPSCSHVMPSCSNVILWVLRFRALCRYSHALFGWVTFGLCSGRGKMLVLACSPIVADLQPQLEVPTHEYSWITGATVTCRPSTLRTRNCGWSSCLPCHAAGGWAGSQPFRRR